MWGSHPPWRSSHTMGGTNGLIRTGPPLKVYRSKTCRACGKPKYLEDFPALPMHHGRRRNICYECFSKEASPTEDSGKSPSLEELSRQEYSIWEEKIPKINLTWDRLWSRGYLPRAAPRNAREILKENPIVGPTCPPRKASSVGHATVGVLRGRSPTTSAPSLGDAASVVASSVSASTISRWWLPEESSNPRRIPSP